MLRRRLAARRGQSQSRPWPHSPSKLRRRAGGGHECAPAQAAHRDGRKRHGIWSTGVPSRRSRRLLSPLCEEELRKRKTRMKMNNGVRLVQLPWRSTTHVAVQCTLNKQLATSTNANCFKGGLCWLFTPSLCLIGRIRGLHYLPPCHLRVSLADRLRRGRLAAGSHLKLGRSSKVIQRPQTCASHHIEQTIDHRPQTDHTHIHTHARARARKHTPSSPWSVLILPIQLHLHRQLTLLPPIPGANPPAAARKRAVRTRAASAHGQAQGRPQETCQGHEQVAHPDLLARCVCACVCSARGFMVACMHAY